VVNGRRVGDGQGAYVGFTSVDGIQSVHVNVLL
jgi:hypothetical protein